MLASGLTAGGYVVGGFAGAASNVASGIKEVKAANQLEKQQKENYRLSQANSPPNSTSAPQSSDEGPNAVPFVNVKQETVDTGYIHVTLKPDCDVEDSTFDTSSKLADCSTDVD